MADEKNNITETESKGESSSEQQQRQETSNSHCQSAPALDSNLDVPEDSPPIYSESENLLPSSKPHIHQPQLVQPAVASEYVAVYPALLPFQSAFQQFQPQTTTAGRLVVPFGHSVLIQCPQCNKPVVTAVTNEPSCFTWSMSGIPC
jgi:hypothetical protein